MNAAIREDIKQRVAAVLMNPASPLARADVSQVEHDAPRLFAALQALGLELYLRGANDALKDEVDRVRADTAAKIAAAEKERDHV